MPKGVFACVFQDRLWPLLSQFFSCAAHCRAEWLPELAAHPSYQSVCRVWDLLQQLLKVVCHPERAVSDAEVDQFTATAAEFGSLLANAFPLAAGDGTVSPGELQQVQVVHPLLGGVWVQQQQPPSIVAPKYAFSFYDHAIISHATWQLRQFGSLKRFGTWHVEHANAWWKDFLDNHTSCGGGWPGLGGATREQQALRRFLIMTDPAVRADMRKELRLRAPRTCRLCLDIAKEGHAQRCPERLRRKAEVAAAKAATEAATTQQADAAALAAWQLPMPSLWGPLPPLAEPAELCTAYAGSMAAAAVPPPPPAAAAPLPLSPLPELGLISPLSHTYVPGESLLAMLYSP